MDFFVHISHANTTYPVGRVYYQESRGRKSASFIYDDEWINHDL